MRRLAALVRAGGLLGSCVLLPLQILVGVAYVVGRQLFTIQLTPLQELEWHLFFAAVFLCLGAAYLADRHVRIDVVRERFAPRTRAKVEIAGFFLALLPFCVAMIYFGTEAALAAFAGGERSRAGLGLSHRWIIKSFVPVGGMLLLTAGLVVTTRAWRGLKAGESSPVADDPGRGHDT